MPDITMADISEFQQSIDAQSYLAAGHDLIICRAHNGYRPDHEMPARRDYLRWHNFTGIGWYLYLAADRDPVEQARELIAVIGRLRGNEWLIVDHEEGSGDQSARAQQALAVLDAWQGFPSMLYSDEAFFDEHLGGAARWHGRPVWIAAYGQSEPSEPHILWQFSSTHYFPGVAGNCDASVHHGTSREFISSVRGGHAPVVPIHALEDPNMITAVVSADGNTHVFLEMPDHSVFYTWQRKGETAWNGGKPGVAPAGFSFFAPAPQPHKS